MGKQIIETSLTDSTFELVCALLQDMLKIAQTPDEILEIYIKLHEITLDAYKNWQEGDEIWPTKHVLLSNWHFLMKCLCETVVHKRSQVRRYGLECLHKALLRSSEPGLLSASVWFHNFDQNFIPL